MNSKKIIEVTVIVMSCLVSSIVSILLVSHLYAQNQYRVIAELTEKLVTLYPNDEQKIIRFIKEGIHTQTPNNTSGNLLATYGFKVEDFSKLFLNGSILISIICTLVFLILFYATLRIVIKYCKERICSLTEYLQDSNMNRRTDIIVSTEDIFSSLQDEIYKTVTYLRQTKDEETKAKKNFADNLANISHQIKTPITSISIAVQMLQKDLKNNYVKQIIRNTAHLEQMADALLVLSRIDAGVLQLEKNQVDIYSVLQMALDNMEEMIQRKEITITMSKQTEITIQGDMNWIVEAFMNLIKNCIEHTPLQGQIAIGYTQNPLYTEITITDSGKGFTKKDLNHIFERFYRGEGGSQTGVGIGLSIAKSIIEMQNGFLKAINLYEGGACFVARFYSH